MFRSLFDYESEQEHRQRTPYKRRHCFGHQEINFSTVFTGQTVGTKEVQDDIWVVSFMDYDLASTENSSVVWRASGNAKRSASRPSKHGNVGFGDAPRKISTDCPIYSNSVV